MKANTAASSFVPSAGDTDPLNSAGNLSYKLSTAGSYTAITTANISLETNNKGGAATAGYAFSMDCQLTSNLAQDPPDIKTKINCRTFKLKGAVFAAAVATLFAVPIANAARVWVGGTVGNETNFNTATNWSPNGTPVAADDLTINTGAAFYPNVMGASTARTITIASGASLTISSGSLTMANDAGITNSGTFTASGTGSLLGNRNLVNNAGGRVSFASSGSSTVRIFTNNSSVTGPDGATISAGTVTLSKDTTNTGTFRITAGTYTISVNAYLQTTGQSRSLAAYFSGQQQVEALITKGPVLPP